MNGRWKRMLFGFMVLPAVLVAVIGATPDEQQLSVMTRNVYIGGNQMDLATATDVASFMVAARTFLTEVDGRKD